LGLLLMDTVEVQEEAGDISSCPSAADLDSSTFDNLLSLPFGFFRILFLGVTKPGSFFMACRGDEDCIEELPDAIEDADECAEAGGLRNRLTRLFGPAALPFENCDDNDEAEFECDAGGTGCLGAALDVGLQTFFMAMYAFVPSTSLILFAVIGLAAAPYFAPLKSFMSKVSPPKDDMLCRTLFLREFLSPSSTTSRRLAR